MGVVSPLPEGGHVVMGLKHLWYEKVESGQVIENLQSICVNAAYVCAAGVGAVAVAYGAARGMKSLSGGVKCVTAVSLAGSLIFGGWRFTYGDVGWTNGFAWVEGYFRARFNSRANEIRLLSDRLALCPAANWSRYSLSASRAWSVTNDVGGFVVTFENAAIADDPTKIASVQMELFSRTGEVVLRYDLANVGDTTYTAGLVLNGTNHFVEVGAQTREVVFQCVNPENSVAWTTTTGGFRRSAVVMRSHRRLNI